jgi:hypothetical protein
VLLGRQAHRLFVLLDGFLGFAGLGQGASVGQNSLRNFNIQAYRAFQVTTSQIGVSTESQFAKLLQSKRVARFDPRIPRRDPCFVPQSRGCFA